MFKTTKRLQELAERMADVCHETNILHRRIDRLENKIKDMTNAQVWIFLNDPPTILYTK